MSKSERPVRGNKYQYLLLEIPVSGFTEKRGSGSNAEETSTNNVFDSLINSKKAKALYDQQPEKFHLLRDQLKTHIRQIVNTSLTPHQTKIVNLTLDGYTQWEITKAIGITNQSSINLCINGSHAGYGGVIKKLKRLVQGNDLIQNILKQIEELDMTNMQEQFKPKVVVPATHFECHRCHKYFHSKDLANGMCGNCVEIETPLPTYRLPMPKPIPIPMNKSSVYYGFSKEESLREDNMESKACSKCEETKPVNQFYKDGKQSSGLTTACKTCLYKPKKDKPMNNSAQQQKDYFLAGAPLEAITAVTTVKAPEPAKVPQEAPKAQPEPLAAGYGQDPAQLLYHFNFFKNKKAEHELKVSEYQRKMDEIKAKIISALD